MTLKIRVALLVLLIVFFPRLETRARALVDSGLGITRESLVFDLIPFAVKTYSSSEVLRIDLSKKIGGNSLVKANGFPSSGYFESSASTVRPARNYWPVVMSLVVPGAGEIYMGYYKRGAALIAMEVAAWAGYAGYRSKGLDSRKKYESFADEHWSVAGWLANHPSGPYASIAAITSDGSNGSWNLHLSGKVTDNFYYMPYISKEENKQDYYEDLGKYNWFISGWDDWPTSPDPPVTGYFSEDTGRRTVYRSMRDKSNNQLTNADRFIYLSIVARAYSLVETILLVRRGGDDEAYSQRDGLKFKVESKGLSSTVLSLEYDF